MMRGPPRSTRNARVAYTTRSRYNPQGEAARKGADRFRYVDHRSQGCPVVEAAGARALRARWFDGPAEIQPARQLDARDARRLFRGARPAAPPAGGRRLPLDRLLAVHVEGQAGR